MTGEFCLRSLKVWQASSEGSGAMVIRLENGGTVTVANDGSVSYRRDRETAWMPGAGSYAETVEWLESVTAGSAGILFTSRKA